MWVSCDHMEFLGLSHGTICQQVHNCSKQWVIPLENHNAIVISTEVPYIGKKIYNLGCLHSIYYSISGEDIVFIKT